MFKNPQSMIRTVMAIMLMIGVAWFQQRMRRTPVERTPDAAPQAISDASTPDTPVDASASKPQPAAARRGPKVASGDFDFYLLSLSWLPAFCSSDAGSGRDGDTQCRSGRPYGFVLHGLWPQNEVGYPENCDSAEPREVSGDIVSEVLKIAPSRGLIQHEWQKHGTCTALSQIDYFATAAKAMQSVKIPKPYRRPREIVRVTGDELRDAFLAENPALEQEDIIVTCRRNELGEVRVCLDKGLKPRACSRETMKSHCGGREARMKAVRENWPRN